MPRVTVVQVVYNNRSYMERVFSAVYAQTFTDMQVVAVISGNADGGKAFLTERFPQVEIIDPGSNVGFAAGHNLVFRRYDSEYFLLVNPDLIMEPGYLEKLVAELDSDPTVAAATGKLLRFDFSNNVPTTTIDSTGVTISDSGRARDRGQHEVDTAQYDTERDLQAISGASALIRKSALVSVAENSVGTVRYFDESFHSYFEDVDLFWRMRNAGWKLRYVPGALAHHGRGAGSSPGGYKKLFSFISHHRNIPLRIRRLNYRNHIFLYLKNSPRVSWRFLAREFCMLGYVVLFEPKTLGVLPELFRLLPEVLAKRKNMLSQHHA